MKLRVVIATIALGTAAALGLTAYGISQVQQGTSSLSPEASALTSVGFNSADLAAVETGTGADSANATPAAKAGKARPLRRLRLYMRKNTLHGQVVVQTKKGPVTIDVQRGTVTAINGDTVTVKSSDGYVLTWTTGTKTAVVRNRARASLTALKVGETVGLAGAQANGTVTARLIVIVSS